MGYEDDLNLYAYVRNDPLNMSDPTGREGAGLWRDQDPLHTTPEESARFVEQATAIGEVVGPMLPGIGDAIGIADAIKNPSPGNIAAAVVGLVPGGDAARPVLRGAGDAASAAVRTCCFVAGTLVDTAEGLRPIEDIEVGDLVLSRDEATGETAYKPVTDLVRRHERPIWRLTLSADGDAAPGTFGTTDDHPWRTADGRWVQTMELVPGMAILRADGMPARVVSIFQTGEITNTYNLEVADWHTYFVGRLRVWVHNACPVPPRGRGSVEPSARDPQRAFSREQRAEMVESQGGRCPQCEGPISADDAVGHHVERHADGGPTTTDNGAALCPECHVDLHRRP